MNDMSGVIIAKSDQLNSDDLISGPITIKIRDVKIKSGEQPVSLFYEGDNDKPWKCCKSMARILVAAWGADAAKYIGRSLTLYRDPTVKWGGMEVGGIRVSHMSHIESEMMMALTATKGRKAPFTVKPLVKAAGEYQQASAAPKFRLIKPDGSHFDFPSAAIWQDKMLDWIAGLKKDKPELLAGFRASNGAIIAEIALDHPEQAKAVDAAFTAALA